MTWMSKPRAGWKKWNCQNSFGLHKAPVQGHEVAELDFAAKLNCMDVFEGEIACEMKLYGGEDKNDRDYGFLLFLNVLL